MSVLVLGGYGAVGGHIVDLLRSDGWEAAAVGRDPARADVRLDLANHDAFTQALAGASCVVNASGAEDPRLAEIAASASVPFVEISATTAYARALEALDGLRYREVAMDGGKPAVGARWENRWRRRALR